MTNKILICFIILGAMVLTLFFFRKYPQWKPDEKNLVLNGGFELGFKHWEWYGNGVNFLQNDMDGARLFMACQKEDQSAVMTQEIPLKENQRNMIFTCMAESKVMNKDIPLQKKPCIFIVYKDYLDKLMWKEVRILKIFDQSSKREKIQKLIEVPPPAKKAVIVSEVEGSIGNLVLDDVELYPAIPETAVTLIKKLLLMFDLGLFVSLYFLLPNQKGKNWVALIATLIVIGVTLPDDLLKHFIRIVFGAPTGSGALPQTLNPWSLGNNPFLTDDLSLFSIKPMTHLAMFTVFTTLTGMTYQHYKITDLLLYLFLFACSTELAQYFTISRTPGFDGIIMDTFGIIAGFICCIFLIKLFSPKQGKPS